MDMQIGLSGRRYALLAIHTMTLSLASDWKLVSGFRRAFTEVLRTGSFPFRSIWLFTSKHCGTLGSYCPIVILVEIHLFIVLSCRVSSTAKPVRRWGNSHFATKVMQRDLLVCSCIKCNPPRSIRFAISAILSSTDGCGVAIFILIMQGKCAWPAKSAQYIWWEWWESWEWWKGMADRCHHEKLLAAARLPKQKCDGLQVL